MGFGGPPNDVVVVTSSVNSGLDMLAKRIRISALLLVVCSFLLDEPPALADTDASTPASEGAIPGNEERGGWFTFVRVKYDSSGGYGESWYRHEGRIWQRWETDYPRAEKNLILRLQQLTTMRVRKDPIVLELTDARLNDYPFLFMSDIGWQVLSDREKSALTRYLAGGGFLWIDDFWGNGERQNLMRNLDGLNPKWRWQRIPDKHPIFSIVYSLDECPQIPARIFYDQFGLDYDPPGAHRYPSGGVEGVNTVNFLGLFDDKDRLMAVATHNTDIADGWEREGESREFFKRFSIKSYAITINILVYAMTH